MPGQAKPILQSRAVYTESDSRIGIGQTRRLEFASGEAGAKKSSLLETRGFIADSKAEMTGRGKPILQ